VGKEETSRELDFPPLPRTQTVELAWLRGVSYTFLLDTYLA